MLGIGEPTSTSHQAPAAQGPEVAGLPRFVTRQPLLDGEYNVVGYELSIGARALLPALPGAGNRRQIQDEWLLASVLDLAFQQALGRRLILLDLAPDTLGSPLVEKLPRDGVILAVRGDAPNPELHVRAQALSRLGFALALDEPAPDGGQLPLARLSRYLRLDVGDNDLLALCDRLVRVRGGQGPRLIARNVQTEEAFTACRQLSFDLYQGFFFDQPAPVRGKDVDTSRLRVMNLLNLVLRRAEFPVLEAELKLDPGLVHKLLRFVNSPAVGLLSPIRDLGQVLLVLGHDALYRWLTLPLFVHGHGQARDRALLRQALARARLMELLAENLAPREYRSGAFVVGILSLLDALLRIPLAEALAGLHLAQPLVDALLRDQGPLSPCLRIAKACEGKGQETVEALGSLDPEWVNRAHLQALIWAEGMDL